MKLTQEQELVVNVLRRAGQPLTPNQIEEKSSLSLPKIWEATGALVRKGFLCVAADMRETVHLAPAYVSLAFSTEEFKRSHAREPRGEGYWAFRFNDSIGSPDFTAHGTITEAKYAARSFAKQWASTRNVRHVMIYVLP